MSKPFIRMTTVKSVTTIEGNFFFSIRVFFHRHWQFTGQQGKGGDHLLFHSATSTRSRTFRHLFATLHVRWLSHIFNRTACIYQTATRWDLPPYRITIWLIDWLIDDAMFVCLLDKLILDFCYSVFDMGQLWIWTCIDYHPCITSEPTNQVYIEGIETMFCLWSFLIFFIKQPMTKRLQKILRKIDASLS